MATHIAWGKEGRPTVKPVADALILFRTSWLRGDWPAVDAFSSSAVTGLVRILFLRSRTGVCHQSSDRVGMEQPVQI